MIWETLGMWIENVPATFWGVLAGSLFTLIGVALTNHANFKRLERQLEHDRGLKADERKLNLKKDVYLPAAEAISAGLMAIGRLADLRIPQDKLLSDWIEKSPAIAKAQLVADEATTEAIARFNAELGATMFRLLAIRLPLTTRLQSADSLMQQVSRHSTENDRMLELSKEMNLSGTHDEQRQTTIDSYFQFNQQRITELLAQHNGQTQALFSDQMQFSKDCQQATAALSILLIPLLACTRKELNLPFNAESYGRITREAHEKIAASLEDFIRNIQRHVDTAFGSDNQS